MANKCDYGAEFHEEPAHSIAWVEAMQDASKARAALEGGGR